MSDYSQITNFTTKDGLASGDPEKIILGSDVDAELAAIATAIATKFDSSDIASDAQAAALTSDTVLITPDKLAHALANASQILFGTGTASEPSIAFSGDPDTGLYSLAANTLGFSTGGTARFAISTTSISGTLPYLQIDGSASAPSYTFTDDLDIGFYRAGANQLGVSAGGTLQALISTNGINLIDGSAAAPSYTFNADGDTGIYRIGANSIGLAAGGTLVGTFSTALGAIDTALLRANGIHNGTAPTGAANQYIASGTYTPTITALDNISSSTSAVCHWLRVGNVVLVSGAILVTANLGTTITRYRLSLPIASNLAIASDLGGAVGIRPSAAASTTVSAPSISADNANDTALVEYVSFGTTSLLHTFSFSYLVI